MDRSPPGSSVHGILQTRILEWVAILFSRGSSQPRDRILVSYIAGGLRTIWVTREALLNLLKNFFRNVSDTHFTQPHKCCSSKESVCQCWRHKKHKFGLWVSMIPWSRKWQPSPIFLPEKFHGQRNLVGYSSCGCKELDMNKHAYMHTHTLTLSGLLNFGCPWLCHWASLFSNQYLFPSETFSSRNKGFMGKSYNSFFVYLDYQNNIPDTGWLKKQKYKYNFILFYLYFWTESVKLRSQ